MIRFSGLTAEMMSAVSTTLRDVQDTLLGMFNSRTILIGHSLESDLMALKVIQQDIGLSVRAIYSNLVNLTNSLIFMHAK